MKLVPTGSQTVGPFFHIGLTRMLIPEVAPPDAEGQRITIQGRVLDAQILLDTRHSRIAVEFAHWSIPAVSLGARRCEDDVSYVLSQP